MLLPPQLLDVHSLEAIGKCEQRQDFSQPRATAGRDLAVWPSFGSQVE
jgi:hypothetical protein